MFYIYACRRDGLTKFYWNRRSNEWETSLTKSCLYPTVKGVNRIYKMFSSDCFTLGEKFHEIGFKREGN